MTDYREMLRLRSLGFNHSKIAESVGASRTTVIAALTRAMAQGIDWHAAEDLSDKELAAKLLQSESAKPVYKLPDYERVHHDMPMPRVTLQLLWFEYCDKCREAGEIPYQLTQFKKYYREFALKNKATMHIDHKPGEIMEVDWAGQTAVIIDTDTGADIEAHICRGAALQRLQLRRGVPNAGSGGLDCRACEHL